MVGAPSKRFAWYLVWVSSVQRGNSTLQAGFGSGRAHVPSASFHLPTVLDERCHGNRFDRCLSWSVCTLGGYLKQAACFVAVFELSPV